MNEQELMKLVIAECAKKPVLFGRIFRVVAEQWEEVVKATAEERQSKHLRTIHDLLDVVSLIHIRDKRKPRLFTNTETCSLMDAIKVRVPKGYDDKSISPAIRNLLDLFVESCRKLGWNHDSIFMRDIRNFDVMLKMLYEQYDKRKKDE